MTTVRQTESFSRTSTWTIVNADPGTAWPWPNITEHPIYLDKPIRPHQVRLDQTWDDDGNHEYSVKVSGLKLKKDGSVGISSGEAHYHSWSIVTGKPLLPEWLHDQVARELGKKQ